MDRKNRKENRGERRGRWSAVDTVILLLIILAIAGVVYRTLATIRKEHTDVSETTYEVYFEVAETHEDTLAEIRGFDAVYLVENQQRLGYIGVYKDLSTGEHRVAMTVTPVAGNGGADRATAIGCMISGGTLTADGSLAIPGSDRYLTPGSELVVRTDRALFTIRVTGIRSHS